MSDIYDHDIALTIELLEELELDLRELADDMPRHDPRGSRVVRSYHLIREAQIALQSV